MISNMASLLLANGYELGTPMHLAVDVSGALQADLAEDFLEQFQQAVRELEPPKVHVYTFSHRLESAKTFEQGTFDPKGILRWTGGGSDLRTTVDLARVNGSRRLFVQTYGHTRAPWDRGFVEVTYFISGLSPVELAGIPLAHGDHAVSLN